MRVLKTFLLLVAVVVASNCTAQSNSMHYPQGLVKFFMEQEMSPIKNKLSLNPVQNEAFTKVMSHYQTKKMSTVGNKNQRKKALKAVQKEQDQTIKSMLTTSQYLNYQRMIRIQRAKK